MGHYRPLYLVIAGILAFILSSTLILNGCHADQQFHELKWNGRSVMNGLIDQSLHDPVDSTITIAAIVPADSSSKDKPGKDSSIKDPAKVQRKALIDLKAKIAAASDEELEKGVLKSLTMNTDSFPLSALAHPGAAGANVPYTLSVPVIYRDASLPTKYISKRV